MTNNLKKWVLKRYLRFLVKGIFDRSLGISMRLDYMVKECEGSSQRWLETKVMSSESVSMISALS